MSICRPYQPLDLQERSPSRDPTLPQPGQSYAHDDTAFQDLQRLEHVRRQPVALLELIQAPTVVGAIGVAPGRGIVAHDGPDKPDVGARTRGQDAPWRGAWPPT